MNRADIDELSDSSARHERGDSLFWQTVWGVVAVSNLIRWPIAAFVFFGGAIAYFMNGAVFWGILWLVILGEIAAGIAMLLTAVPFFVLGVLLAAVVVAIRWLWRQERRALDSLPFEVRRRSC